MEEHTPSYIPASSHLIGSRKIATSNTTTADPNKARPEKLSNVVDLDSRRMINIRLNRYLTELSPAKTFTRSSHRPMANRISKKEARSPKFRTLPKLSFVQ